MKLETEEARKNLMEERRKYVIRRIKVSATRTIASDQPSLRPIGTVQFGRELARWQELVYLREKAEKDALRRERLNV